MAGAKSLNSVVSSGVVLACAHSMRRVRNVNAPYVRRGPMRRIKKSDLYRLYVTNGLPVYKVAKELDVSVKSVVRELNSYSIELRPRGYSSRTRSELDGLKIGESAIMAYPASPKPYSSIYPLARSRGMKVSIRRIDAGHVRVTRLK